MPHLESKTKKRDDQEPIILYCIRKQLVASYMQAKI